jgi:hypothetical protein
LKQSLSPANLAKETFNKVLSLRPATMLAGSGLLKGALVFGATVLAKRLADKGGQKLLGKLLKKG